MPNPWRYGVSTRSFIACTRLYDKRTDNFAQELDISAAALQIICEKPNMALGSPFLLHRLSVI